MSARSNITPTKNTSNQTWNHTSNLTGLTLANSFTYTVLATDAFGKTAQTSVTLGPAIVAMALGRETAFFNDVVIDKHLAILKSDGTLNGYLDATKFGELLYFSSGAKLLSTGKDVSFTAANIPNLNTSKLTAGVMAAARLPFEYKQKTVSYVSSYLSSGSTVTWHMFRFNSIFTIIYTAFTSSDMACTTAWGSMYYCSPAHSTPSYPITFASMPYSNISYTGASTAGFAIVLPYGDASTSYPGGFSLGRMNSSTMKAPRISIVAIGSFTGTLPSD